MTPLDADHRNTNRLPHERRGLLHDTLVITRRGLVHLRRRPESLSDATIQPIMFVLLFAYVFGGAIDVPGDGNYREFLMGGIFAQTIVFAAFGVARSIANDRQNQVVDRLRSLPMVTGAVLAGHAVANLVKGLIPIALLSGCGLLIGWRIRSGITDAMVGYGLLVAFAFAMIWIGVLLGSVTSTPEATTGLTFFILFPLTFLAGTFVPTASMPGALRAVAEWSPVTALANASRIQFGNPTASTGPGDPWSIQHPLAYAALWAIGIVALGAPIAVRAYRRSLPDRSVSAHRDCDGGRPRIAECGCRAPAALPDNSPLISSGSLAGGRPRWWRVCPPSTTVEPLRAGF